MPPSNGTGPAIADGYSRRRWRRIGLCNRKGTDGQSLCAVSDPSRLKEDPMAGLFAVTSTHGARYDSTRPLEEQEDWPAHAAFMDALEAEGVVVLGGPLEGTPDVLLIVRARDAD